MKEILNPANIINFFKFFAIYFIEISLLFIVVSFFVSILSSKFDEKLKIALANNKFSSYIKAFLIGSLTPFCSCSTIPMLNGFLQAKIKLGVSAVFLLSSPLVNPIVITLFVLTLGVKFAMIYFITVFFCAVFFGFILDKFDEKNFLRPNLFQTSAVFSGQNASKFNSSSNIKFKSLNKTQCECRQKHKNIYKTALKKSFFEYKKIFFYIVVAMFVGAAIHGFVPKEIVNGYLGKSDFYSVLAASLFGVLLYVRVETLIPIGTALLSSGASSAAFGAFVITAAGISLPEIILLRRFFTIKFIGIFIVFICLSALVFGMFLR